jgi:O-antigen ligase
MEGGRMAALRQRDERIAEFGSVLARPDVPPPDAAVVEAAASDGEVSAHAMLLVAALAAAIGAQGAFYRSGQVVVAVAVVVAAGAAVAARDRIAGFPTGLLAAVAGAAGLGCWALVRATLAGEPAAGAGTALLLAGLVIVSGVAAACHDRDRQALLSALVALGVLAALSGWAGVTWRLSPLAIRDQGLWRAATTITYANVAAGLLTAMALVALGLLVESRTRPRAAALCMLLIGASATLSRGGTLALVCGGVTLGALVGVRRVAAAFLAPALGAAVALLGLVPSLPDSASPRPALAAVALLAGLGIAAVGTGYHRPAAVLASGVVVLLAGTLLVAFMSDGRSGQAVARMRLTADSPERVQEVSAALRLVREEPVVGVGPGRARLSLVDDAGRDMSARYAHNEYLQVLAELGAVGFALLIALLVTVGRAVGRGRRAVASASAAVWAGGVAALVALAVHGLFDFGWHVPAVPLTAALLVGALIPRTTHEQEES